MLMKTQNLKSPSSGIFDDNHEKLHAKESESERGTEIGVGRQLLMILSRRKRKREVMNKRSNCLLEEAEAGSSLPVNRNGAVNDLSDSETNFFRSPLFGAHQVMHERLKLKRQETRRRADKFEPAPRLGSSVEAPTSKADYSDSCYLFQLEKRKHKQPQGKQRAKFPKAASNKMNVSAASRLASGLPFMLLSICVSILMLIMLLATYTPVVESVDCFKCSSRNGSNPACEDPFHNLNTSRVISPILPDPAPSVIYHTPCYAGKKGREGLFPASACIKLTGTFESGETLVVRHCALDSGSLTQDTELARMSHCGKFHFEGDHLNGCVLACPEDACNGATILGKSYSMALVILTSISSFFFFLLAAKETVI